MYISSSWNGISYPDIPIYIIYSSILTLFILAPAQNTELSVYALKLIRSGFSTGRLLLKNKLCVRSFCHSQSLVLNMVQSVYPWMYLFTMFNQSNKVMLMTLLLTVELS